MQKKQESVANMNNKESIEKTKQGFETSFSTCAYYDKQTKDENHLESILHFLHVKPGMKILDLGTGTGYLAFPIAEKNKEVEVTGLDIVEKALEENRKKAESKKIHNLRFVSYDGMKFPFDDNCFDMVVSRYALHHFPAIQDTFHEINRVLKKDGLFFLSDPAPNDNDTEHFVDAYMQMKKDGHIKFYTKAEWKNMAKIESMEFVDGFETSIRFPRKKETSLEFDDIIRRYDENVIKGYEVEVIDNEIWITERVSNLMFKKC